MYILGNTFLLQLARLYYICEMRILSTKFFEIEIHKL